MSPNSFKFSDTNIVVYFRHKYGCTLRSATIFMSFNMSSDRFQVVKKQLKTRNTCKEQPHLCYKTLGS